MSYERWEEQFKESLKMITDSFRATKEETLRIVKDIEFEDKLEQVNCCDMSEKECVKEEKSE